MHEVHTRMRLLPASVCTRTFCRLGSQRRLVCRCEWLTLQPVDGFLPQMTHILDMRLVPSKQGTPKRGVLVLLVKDRQLV